ncbi:hypothetical protein BSKO_03038 [Bryopsis sp. KO-2023]|nr:hypothetical protein BSKO_03038 [Bryopsis sp. KO-2023]
MVNPVLKVLQPCVDAIPVDVHYGEEWEQKTSLACQWFALITSLMILTWYTKQMFKKHCGWEEYYVCLVETVKVILDMNVAYTPPASIYQYNGVYTHWLRYCEWLLTCPVILIHLANITGLPGDTSKRGMKLVVSDIGTIVFGATAAFTKGNFKILFYMIGLTYGSNTFFSAAKAFIEGYHKVPKGRCRNYVKGMAYAFFGSWVWYPILFMLGPEGFGHLSIAGSDIGHTAVDMFSKNIFGFLGHFLRLEIQRYVLKHGDIRKKEKINVGGEIMEVEVFNDGDADGDDGDETPDTRTRMLRDSTEQEGAQLEDGRVLLGCKDSSMIPYFHEEFAKLPGRIQLLTALGSDGVAQAAQQAVQMGGLDYVLLHPDMLVDQKLLTFLRGQLGVRVCAFGWSSTGPMREALESAPIDGLLEGPSMGKGLNLEQLIALTAQMQQMRSSVSMANPVFGTQAFGMGQTMGFGGMSRSGSVTPQQQQQQAENETVETLMREINALKTELETPP